MKKNYAVHALFLAIIAIFSNIFTYLQIPKVDVVTKTNIVEVTKIPYDLYNETHNAVITSTNAVKYSGAIFTGKINGKDNKIFINFDTWENTKSDVGDTVSVSWSPQKQMLYVIGGKPRNKIF